MLWWRDIYGLEGQNYSWQHWRHRVGIGSDFVFNNTNSVWRVARTSCLSGKVVLEFAIKWRRRGVHGAQNIHAWRDLWWQHWRRGISCRHCVVGESAVCCAAPRRVKLAKLPQLLHQLALCSSYKIIGLQPLCNFVFFKYKTRIITFLRTWFTDTPALVSSQAFCTVTRFIPLLNNVFIQCAKNKKNSCV